MGGVEVGGGWEGGEGEGREWGEVGAIGSLGTGLEKMWGKGGSGGVAYFHCYLGIGVE